MNSVLRKLGPFVFAIAAVCLAYRWEPVIAGAVAGSLLGCWLGSKICSKLAGPLRRAMFSIPWR